MSGHGDSASQQPVVETTGSMVYTDYRDGHAEIYFQHIKKSRIAVVGARLWGLFITAYLVWALLPLPFIVYFWGSFVKRLLVIIILVYAPSYFDKSEQTGGREWDALRQARIWRQSHDYFHTRTIRECKLDAGTKYIFNFHPHGILVLSKIFFYGGVWEKLFPGVECRVLAATPLFYIPFCREICLWMSAIDAGRKTAERMLKKGLSLMIYPGGSKELFLTDPNSTDTTIVLRERKGFVRLALRNGAHLVPVLVFGEKWCYKLLRPPLFIRNFFLKTLKVPVLIFWGRFFTWIPFEVPLTCLIGRPIPVERVENPSDEEVQALQLKYEHAVVELFEKHKARAGYSDIERLVIT